MSVFLAVDLDDPSRASAAAVIETHRANAPGAKWLRLDKLHCTVVFLGNPKPEQVASWLPLIDALAERHQTFSLRLQGAGTFVTARAPSVLWLGVQGELDKLAALHLDALETFDTPLSPTLSPLRREREQGFVPHVTLARSQTDGHFEELARELRTFSTPDFEVRVLSLYESSNHVYRVVHHAPLRLLKADVHR